MTRTWISVSLFFCMALFGASSPSVAQDDEKPMMWGGEDLAPFLKTFTEPKLWGPEKRPETYRLLISASIVIGDGGRAIRLERRSDDDWLLTTKSITRGRLKRWTRHLGAADVRKLRELVQSDAFWQSPTRATFYNEEAAKDGELQEFCVDGVYWILEANIEGRYHATGAAICGSDNVLVPGGTLLIEMTGRDLGPYY